MVRDSEATIPAAVAVVLAVAPLAVPGVRTAADAPNHLAVAVAAAVLDWELDAVVVHQTMAFIYPTFQQPH